MLGSDNQAPDAVAADHRQSEQGSALGAAGGHAHSGKSGLSGAAGPPRP